MLLSRYIVFERGIKANNFKVHTNQVFIRVKNSWGLGPLMPQHTGPQYFPLSKGEQQDALSLSLLGLVFSLSLSKVNFQGEQ